MALPQSQSPLTQFNYSYDVQAQIFPHFVEDTPTFEPNGVSIMPLGNNPANSVPLMQWGSPRPQQELTGLSETMSELAISDCAQPPPSKIRRRNALTIQDTNLPIFQFSEAGLNTMHEHQLPQQPDAFERSFLLQVELEFKWIKSTFGKIKFLTQKVKIWQTLSIFED